MKTYIIEYNRDNKREREIYNNQNECMKRMAQLTIQQRDGKISKLELKSTNG